ncbi:MAG: AMP-binding protein, partial [Bacteroidota bacterium]
SGNAYSFSELKEEVESRAAYLYKHGIRSQDQVLLCLPNDIDLFRNVLALFYLGAIAVLPKNWNDKAHVEHICKQTDCKALIGVPKARIMAYFSKCMRSIPIKLEAHSQGFRSIFPRSKVHPEQTALISFQDAEKGILLAEKRSHVFLYQKFQSQFQLLDPKQWEIALHTSPLMVLCYLSIGNSSIIPEIEDGYYSSKDLAKLIQQLSLYKVNRFNTHAELLLKLSEFLIEQVEELVDIGSIYCEGRPLLDNEARLLSEAFPHAKILLAYGDSEVAPISIRNLDKLKADKSDKGIALGQIHKEVEIRLIDFVDSPLKVASYEELEYLSLPSNQIGEILVKSPLLIPGYYEDFDAFERNKVVVEGDLWHRSGDAGLRIKEHLFYCGKCKDLISHQGKYYAPILYENYLTSFSKVKKGSLIKIQEQLCLVLELKKEQDKSAVIKQLTHASLKFEKVIFLKKIPMKSEESSKIDYTKLQSLLHKSDQGSTLNLEK